MALTRAKALHSHFEINEKKKKTYTKLFDSCWYAELRHSFYEEKGVTIKNTKFCSGKNPLVLSNGSV